MNADQLAVNTPATSPRPDGAPTLRIRAVMLGERINPSGLEIGPPVSSTPAAFRVHAGLAVIFRYGVVVLIGLLPSEEKVLIDSLKPRVIGELSPHEEEIAHAQLCKDESAEAIQPGGWQLNGFGSGGSNGIGAGPHDVATLVNQPSTARTTPFRIVAEAPAASDTLPTTAPFARSTWPRNSIGPERGMCSAIGPARSSGVVGGGMLNSGSAWPTAITPAGSLTPASVPITVHGVNSAHSRSIGSGFRVVSIPPA